MPHHRRGGRRRRSVKVYAPVVEISGSILANGGRGGHGLAWGGGGGGGAGGTIWIRAGQLELTGVLSAAGGAAGMAGNTCSYRNSGAGGAGSQGRIRLDYDKLSGAGKVTPPSGFQGGCP